LSSQLPILGVLEHPELVMKLPPTEVLLQIGRAYFAFSQSNAQALKLVVGEAVRRPEVAEMFIRGGPDRMLGFLKAYLEHQIKTGKLRTHDVRSSTQTFIGMLIPQIANNLLFTALTDDGLTNEEHLKAVADLFLRGLEPEESGEEEQGRR
jgi:transcriptional repressor AefR-like protein